MLIGSFAALPTMPVLTKLLPLPDAVLAFLASVATLESMASVGGIFKNSVRKHGHTGKCWFELPLKIHTGHAGSNCPLKSTLVMLGGVRKNSFQKPRTSFILCF